MGCDKRSLMMYIDSISSELKDLAIFIHDNPEVAMEEEKACKAHSEYLRSKGFSVETGISGLPTAFKAVYKGKEPGPIIAFIEEYDALPDVGHGCGHNLIGAASAGAAAASRHLADSFGGEIRVYGTPAEEIICAKIEMVDDGVFDDCDAILMSHPGYVTMNNMNTLALQLVSVEFFGKAAHASGSPGAGINALDSMIDLFVKARDLRKMIGPSCRLNGIIKNGGTVPNVIPSYTNCEFVIRAQDIKKCESISGELNLLAQSAAEQYGCTYRYTVEKTIDEAIQNVCLSGLATENMRYFGQAVTDMTGKRLSVSSDLGNVSKICPSLQMVFSIGVPDSGDELEAHTLGFARDAASERGLDAMIRMSKVLAMTAYDLMSEPDNLKKVKEEFKTSK